VILSAPARSHATSWFCTTSTGPVISAMWSLVCSGHMEERTGVRLPERGLIAARRGHGGVERAAARRLQAAAAHRPAWPGEGAPLAAGAGRRPARRPRSRHAGPPFSGLAEWLANRQRQAEQLAKRGRGGMRWLSGGWRRRWAPGRPTPTRPPATKTRRPRAPAAADSSRGWEGEERDRKPEEDFGESWHTYRERTDHIRQTYGCTVPEPPPRVEH
jgi:hypothetical protein